jgi:primosomal protein N' (replication factor Y)
VSPAGVTAGVPGAVVSVLPDVAGLDRSFDYFVPETMRGSVRLGSVVRADLAGRRIAGWVVADGVVPPSGVALRPLRRLTGWGPAAEVIDLAGWAAWRWAGRRRSLLATASPPRAVAVLPAADRRPPAPPPAGTGLTRLVDAACAVPVGILRLPPATDVTAAVAAVAQRGPTLVVVPTAARAAVLAGRLRRAGAGVAELPHQWALARAGAGVVVGTRAAAWGPCPDLAAVVVVDAHDEGLAQQQAPTWWAATVAAERARRAGVPCVWITPCSTLDLLAAGTLVTADATTDRTGWAPVEVVDRRSDDPHLGLYGDRVATELRAARRAVCVLNRTGRARLLACGACGELARCEHCGAALAQATGDEVADSPVTDSPVTDSPVTDVAFTDGPGRGASGTGAGGAGRPLVCRRCAMTRPPVCAACDSTRLRHLRVGVTRVREELEALLGRPVAEVTSASGPDATTALGGDGVAVGTEAILHRATTADVVVFLDFDQELLAPRLRAGEEALALLALAARLVGGRRRGGRVIVQTRVPDHAVLRAAVRADSSVLTDAESDLRRGLGLPPDRALVAVSGPAAGELVAGVPPDAGVEVVGPADGRWLLRGRSAATVCDALAVTPRPSGRVRIEVDPLRV